MISKELLSKVLSEEVIEIDELKFGSTIYFIKMIRNADFGHSKMDAKVRSEINVYELMHKCKKWANRKLIKIDSSYLGLVDIYYDGKSKGFVADTEPESVFKATEWIESTLD